MEFNWRPTGNNTRRYGEVMSDTGPVCYVNYVRQVSDGRCTEARDGTYMVTVCRPHTYITYSDGNYANRLMCREVHEPTLEDACRYAEAWVEENIE